MQYQENVHDILTKIPNSTIWSPLVQHSAFSDNAYFAAKTPNYGMNSYQALFNWLFKKGPYFSNTDTNLGNYNPNSWFSLYPHYILSWLNQNLLLN